MATGTRPFIGNTSFAVASAILNNAPKPATSVNPLLPMELGHIIDEALEKDRDFRCQTASEMRAQLKRLKRETEWGKSMVRPAMSRRKLRRAIWIAAGVIAVLIPIGAVSRHLLWPASQNIDSVAVLPFGNVGGWRTQII
jgi:hypothetical protein